jgi:hypothetical protein
LQILHEEGLADAEKYFVAGGYALTHENSVTVSILLGFVTALGYSKLKFSFVSLFYFYRMLYALKLSS